MTPKILEAIVEGNVLRPLQKLELPDQQHVRVTIISMEEETTETTVSCYDLARKLGVIGVVADTPTDLSTNPAHLEGFGTE